MVIDVIDLDFDSLDFNRDYEKGRYSRGRDLYNREKAIIKNVDKINEDSYVIDAKVQGNYGLYSVKLKIQGDKIKDSSCTCEDYNNGYLCKHIIAAAMEVIGPHSASTKEGQKRIEKKRDQEIKKTFEAIRKKQQLMLEEQLYKRKYHSGLKALEDYKSNVGIGNEDIRNIKNLYEKTLEAKRKASVNLDRKLKLEYSIEIEDPETIKVAFKIGQTRMYVLNNLSDFYEAYRNGTELFYGKQLTFIPKRENFTEESKEWFDFIIKYAEMIEYGIRNNEYGVQSSFDKYLYISSNQIDDFFALNKNKDILVKIYGELSNYEITNEKLDIGCSFGKETVEISNYDNYWRNGGVVKEKSEEYVLKLNITNYKLAYGYDKIYVFYQGKIYILNKNAENSNLFRLFKDEEKILVPEDKIDEFKQTIFPRLNIKVENEKQVTNQAFVVDKLASKILLDVDEEGNIMLELKFCYNDHEFNVLEKGYEEYVKEQNIVRDIPKETEVIKRLFMDGFEPVLGEKELIMKNIDDMYEFLSYKIEGYMNDFEVLVTDKFKNKQIKRPKISSLGIKIDNGLLELDISKINIDINEIKNILKDYNLKKKYYKLQSGDLLDLTGSDDLDLLDEMTTTLDIDYNKVNDGVIDLPINRSFYLEKLVDSKKEITVDRNEKFLDLINNIGNTEKDNIKLNKEFEDKLRDYQKTGYKWLKNLASYKFGGILADDMGLGKTLQIIAILRDELEAKNEIPSIVVCPSTLVLNWKAEIEKWCQSMKVLIIKGTAEERNQELSDYKNYDLVITSYDLLKRDVLNYEDKSFKYIIADEAQYIKNSLTQNATALKSLKGEIKFALTGTPIENSVSELWSIFDFIMPGYLYNYHKFRNKFEEPILKYEDKEALTRLKKLISPFILRRVKKDVLTELPDKNITVMKNEMEKEQEKIYLAYLAKTQKEVATELSDSTFEKSKFKILALLTRLRQICCHPSLFIENYHGGSGKLKQCIDLTKDAIDAGHKVLIFSSYTSMFPIIEEELEKQDIKYFKLIGSTPVGQRIEMVDEFNNDESVKVFLISLKAGGTGLNLTSADVVIHFDPWWNVSSENQATDRAYRIGQKNSVQVYKLITSNSIEEKINKMQERKEKLSKDILSTEETFINKLSKEDILDLFK